jgi:hypothetical protein
MARGRIRLDQIGGYVEDRLNTLLRATVLETDSRLKQASPVDTGRFRASWQVGENAAPGKGAPPGNYSGQYPIQRTGYSQERVGNVYSVHNNLPYAEPLAGGPGFPPSWKAAGVTSSSQAPAGWVQGIAKDMQANVLKNAARIGRTYTRNRE